MWRFSNILLGGLLLMWELGCGSPSTISPPTSGTPSGVPSPSTSSQVITSISPVSVTAGSQNVMLTIKGSKFDNQFLRTSVAFWTTDPTNLHDHGTMLNTTFVSGSQLTAVIPAALLQDPVSVEIIVVTGDPMGMSDGFFGYPKSNALTFTVTP
jgi:hypothetical protein